VGLAALFLLRLRPSRNGVIFSAAAFLFLIGIMLTVMGSGIPSRNEAATQVTPTNQTLPSPTPNLPIDPEPSATPEIFTPTPVTPSPVPVTIEITLPPTQTPTITLTIPPAPVYGRIQANEGGGANLRDAAGGTYLMTLLNGTIVETYGEVELVGTVRWIKIYASLNGQQIEGWTLESVLQFATPAPETDAPAATPTVPVTQSP
jgi:hypothetical protein